MYCKDCRREINKRHYERTVMPTLKNKVKKIIDENEKNKIKARTYINRLVRTKKIKKENCFVCNSNLRIEAHHLDYNYPDKVIWLCRKHHNKQHYLKLH